MVSKFFLPTKISKSDILNSTVSVTAIIAILIVVRVRIIEFYILFTVEIIATKQLCPVCINRFPINFIIASEVIIVSVFHVFLYTISSVLKIKFSCNCKLFIGFSVQIPFRKNRKSIHENAISKAVFINVIKIILVGIVYTNKAVCVSDLWSCRNIPIAF